MAHSSKHGHRAGYKESSTYTSWRSMGDRVRRKTCNSHEYYSGNRLVKICDRWSGPGGFLNFLNDMGERPENTTLSRIHPWGWYEKSNCCWQSPKKQANNTRDKVKIRVMGVKGDMAYIARKTGMKPDDIHGIMRMNYDRTRKVVN
jgi:hypothetical protein